MPPNTHSLLSLRHSKETEDLQDNCVATERGDPKVVVWVLALPNYIKKHKRAKQSPEDSPLQEAVRKPKNSTIWGGGWVLSLANVNKHLPAALFLHLKSLGNSIQHLKISLLRLLRQAMARFLTHKQLSVKPKMELLIKLILYRISCWLNWFSLTSGRKAW